VGSPSNLGYIINMSVYSDYNPTWWKNRKHYDFWQQIAQKNAKTALKNCRKLEREIARGYALVPVLELIRFLSNWIAIGKPEKELRRILHIIASHKYIYEDHEPRIIWREVNDYSLTVDEERLLNALGLPLITVKNWVRIPGILLLLQLDYFTKCQASFLLATCLKYIHNRNSSRISYTQFCNAFGFSKPHTSASVARLLALKLLKRSGHIGAEHWRAWWHGSRYEIYSVSNPKYSLIEDKKEESLDDGLFLY
jgi:hypothetical protein